MGKTDKVIKIGSNKEATINKFKGKYYVHFLDKRKAKTITFSSEEFRELVKKADKIKRLMKGSQKKGKKPAENNSDSEMSVDSDDGSSSAD